MQVQNRRMLDTLYHTLYADEIKMMKEAEQEESLYHHGVEGMSWGDRNGPPYPLGGVDKKVARAEYKAKKEKERRLKKLQRTAKKARKVKAKNAKQEAEILKKKQKLVKEGDLDKIRKNANLFTNEELQYVIERDNQKRSLGSKDERTADEKFELAMKRMAQIGDIAANAGKVLSAAKIGADLLTSFKSAKVKDLEAEDKRLSAIKTEFEMRFKGRENSPEAQRFVNAAVNNEQYEPSKAEKKEAKAKDKARIDATKTSALDKKANKVLDKEYAEEIRERDKAIDKKIKDRKAAERKEFFDKFKRDKDDPDKQKKSQDREDKKIAKQLKEIDKMPNKDAALEYLNRSTIAQQQAHQSVVDISSSPQKDSGKTFVNAFLGSPKGGVGTDWKVNNGHIIDLSSPRGSARDAIGLANVGPQWVPTKSKDWVNVWGTGKSRKKEVTANRAEAGNVSGHNTEPASRPSYSLPGRSSWSSKPVSSISKTTPEPKSNALVEAEKRAAAIRERMRQDEQRHEAFKSQLKAMQDYHKEEQKREEKIRAGARIGGYKAQTNYYDKVSTWLRDTGGLKTMSSTQYDQLSKASKDIGRKETERLLKEWWDIDDSLR